MELNEWYTVEILGKVVRKEVSKNGRIYVALQNEENNEYSIILERDTTKSKKVERPK